MDNLTTLPRPNRIEVDAGQLAGFTAESEFMELAFNLLREVTQYVCIAACTLGPRPKWARDQAIIGGHMVRLFKLLSALLDQTAQYRRETDVIFGRLTFETAVNVRYLMANFTPEIVDSYVRYSLRHERKLRDHIQANIAARGGQVLPIEERMLRSISRSADEGGVALDDVDIRERTPWGGKNLYQRAQELGWENSYLAMFGGMSHHVHGNWQDLCEYHLETDEQGGFSPFLEWSRPRPQMFFALGVLLLQTVLEFFRFVEPSAELTMEIDEAMADLDQRVRMVNDAHEFYLMRKTATKG